MREAIAELSPRAWATYCALRLYADFQTGECYPSISRLGRDCRCGESAVRRAIDELVERGYVRRKLRTGETSLVTLKLGVTAPKRTTPSKNGTPPKNERGTPFENDGGAAKRGVGRRYGANPLWAPIRDEFYRDWEQRTARKPVLSPKALAGAYRIASAPGMSLDEFRRVLAIAWRRDQWPFRDTAPLLETIAQHLDPLRARVAATETDTRRTTFTADETRY